MKTKPKKTVNRDPKNEIVSNNIEQLRKKKNWTISDLSIASRTTLAHLYKIESGERKQVSVPVAARIAKALNVSIEDVFVCNI